MSKEDCKVSVTTAAYNSMITKTQVTSLTEKMNPKPKKDTAKDLISVVESFRRRGIKPGVEHALW